MKILAKDINLLNVNKSGASLTINECPMWRQIGPNHFVFESYYDLAGMSLEEKTLFFEAATVQSVSLPSANNTRIGDAITIMDLMSSREINNLQAVLTLVYGNFAGNVNDGSGQGPLSFQETIYARVQNSHATLILQLGDS